jgi:hypothetical protein
MFKRGDGWTILGAFQSYDGFPRQCLARLNLNGSLNSLFPSFTTALTLPSQPAVFAAQASPQGIYIAGEFSGYGGKLHRKVARVKFNGANFADIFQAGKYYNYLKFVIMSFRGTVYHAPMMPLAENGLGREAVKLIQEQ